MGICDICWALAVGLGAYLTSSKYTTMKVTLSNYFVTRRLIGKLQGGYLTTYLDRVPYFHQ